MQDTLYGLAASLALGLTACTAYQAKPLQAQPDFAMPRTVNAAVMPLPELAAHRFDARDGLDMTEVAMLAVANNPQVKLARADRGVSRAQAFAAGLLPDPQLNLVRDFPTNGTAANTSAFNLGISYDFGALVARSAGMDAARAALRQTDLKLLWQEWQVVSQARLLFVRTLMQERLMAILQAERTLFADRYARIERALERGDVTRDVASTDLAALQAIDTRVNDLARQRAASGHDLNALLGLAADTQLTLVSEEMMPGLDVNAVRDALKNIAERRPDLRALQAGYASQEARYRQAVLAQFPALNIGFTRARDTSGLYTRGFGVTLSLPIFNRNRGNIAIESATRERLHEEYQTRLNTAVFEVERMLAEQQQFTAQWRRVEAGLADLEANATAGEKAYERGALDELVYLNLRASLLNRRMDALTLQQSLLELQVALQTLLGSLPQAAPVS